MEYKFSIVIPCFNEEATVFEVVYSICSSFTDTLVVVVNDGSTDNSKQELTKLNFNNFKFIDLVNNSGKGFALRAGLNFVREISEIVIFTDADKEVDILDIQKVQDKYDEKNIEAVFGSRFLELNLNKKIKMGYHRFLANKILTIFTNIVFKQNLTDMETAVKSFKTKYINNFNLESDGFEIEPEIVKELAKNKVKIVEIPINYSPRSIKEGKKISYKDGFKTIFFILKLILQTNRKKKI